MPRSPRSKEEKPRPEIFAILRNGHEVIRGATPHVKYAIGEADFEGALELWKYLARWKKMHTSMEEGNDNCKGFFWYVPTIWSRRAFHMMLKLS
jgi:hypothetical protein